MKRLFTTLIFLLIFVGIISVQFFYDREQVKINFIEPIVFKPEVVRAANFGLDNAASDLMWLAAIQYFGGGESRTYEKLPDYLNLASDLDPKFSYPYAFGSLILPTIGFTDQGIALANKGIANNVDDWRIPYYIATTFYFNKNDVTSAYKYFDLAANTPGAPASIQKIAANFGSRTDKREQTIQIWTGIYETTNDSVVKERAKNYLIHFELMDILDEASAKYYNIYKKYPLTPDDLVAGKILKTTPVDPFGFTFKFGDNGKVIPQ